MDRLNVAFDRRRRIGLGLVALLACLPLGGVVALATSPRGLTGEISHDWHSLTNPNRGVGDTPGRLVQVSNSRARYWREGFDVGSHALLKGVGALGFGTARTRFSSDARVAEHAHSYVVETFADFGLLGLFLSLGLLVAWLLAAARTLATPTLRRLAWLRLNQSFHDAPTRPAEQVRHERIGLVTLFAVVLIFGVHSAIDWTWFVPGVTVPALVCAGWLAGRGPVALPAGEWRLGGGRPDLLMRGAVAAITALAVGCAWMIWQPLRSANADQSALASLAAGRSAQALSQA